jgi:hypothetical protein
LAIDLGFAKVKELFSLEVDMPFAYDARETADVALSLLLDRFEAKGNGYLTTKIKSILQECNYDIETATQLICQISESRIFDNKEYPDLLESMSQKSKPVHLTHPSSYAEATAAPASAASSASSAFELTSSTSSKSKSCKIVLDESLGLPKSVSSTNNQILESQYWRSCAEKEWTLMTRSFAESATSSNRKSGASILHSTSARQHQNNMHLMNRKASICTIKANNPHIDISVSSSGDIEFSLPSPPPSSSSTVTIDCHGISSKEAVDLVESIFDYLHFNSKTSVRGLNIIVGQGRHSKDGQRKLAPAVRKYLDSIGIRSQDVDGVIVVKFR